jgi:hypothetical protein
MQTIRSAGDSSFDAAGRLGSVLISLRETAANASQHIEGTVERLGKLVHQMPASAATQTQQLRAALDQQADAARDLTSRVTSAFDRVRQVEPEKAQSTQSRPQQPVPHFNVPPQANMAPPPRNQVQPAAPPPATPEAASADQQRGWFGRAKRFVRPPEAIADAPDDRSAWDMKSLLAAAESEASRPAIQHQAIPPQRPPQPRVVELRTDQMVPESTVKRAPHPATPPNAKNGNGEQTATSSRHMIETLQAMAIDLDRFLEDDPPLDLLRRYRNGERNVFARRLVSILGREQAEAIGRKYAEDGEFRETVDRYILQFEALMEQTARSDRENVLVETYLTSQTGKVYVALASAIGRLS